MTPDLFREACRALVGEEWHRPIARLLGEFHPDGPRDQIDDRLVRRWAAGEREIAPWVPGALAILSERQVLRHQLAVNRLRDLAKELRAVARR